MALWILDASHGGDDPGVVGGFGRRESDIVLEAVLEAKRHLERNGEKVILTRNSDENVTMEKRIEIANSSQGQFFISFNMNSHIDKNIKGVTTLYGEKEYDNERLARLIKDELCSGFRTKDNGASEDLSKIYDEINAKKVIVFADYLTNNDIELNFDSKKLGTLIAKACLAMVDKVLLISPITEPKEMQEKGWRVCIGYYKEYDQAIKFMKELQRKGMKDVYVTPYNGK